MTIRGWWRRRKHRRRWRRAERGAQGPLREFVYLDEVSVYSLVASQVGAVVTEVTETQASSLQSEVSSGLGVTGPLKAEVGSRVHAGETHSSQVLRKAIIQTTFKQLHETALKSGALWLHADCVEQTAVRNLDDIKRLALSDSASSMVVPPDRLRRGDLIEMDVQLEAEPIFQAGMAVSGVLDIIQDDPKAFGVPDVAQLSQVRLMSRMLDKVLAGLVPVRGRAANYSAVELDGDAWLIHTQLIAQLSEPPPETPVFLVGVAQEGLFWKDVRRVLFSGSQYRVLARMSRSGLAETWTPVKLVDVLSAVVPDFADVMDTLNRDVLSTMSAAVATQQEPSASALGRSAAMAYAGMLAGRAGVEVDEAELERSGALDSLVGDVPVGSPEWRDMLAPVTRFVEDLAGHAFAREVAADYRAAAVIQAGLLEPVAPAPNLLAEQTQAPERFLDSEIVAVYW